MGNLSNRAIHEVFGCPSEDNTVVLEFTTSAVSTQLAANNLYRFAATEDCYITINSDASGSPATADGVLVFAGVPEIFSTTGKNVYVSALRKDADGDLHITKMITRGN